MDESRAGHARAPRSRPLTAEASRRSPYADDLLLFLRQLAAGKAPAAADKALSDVDLQARAYAYSAAIVLLGERAPAEWRTLAQRALFASERPFFR